MNWLKAINVWEWDLSGVKHCTIIFTPAEALFHVLYFSLFSSEVLLTPCVFSSQHSHSWVGLDRTSQPCALSVTVASGGCLRKGQQQGQSGFCQQFTRLQKGWGFCRLRVFWLWMHLGVFFVVIVLGEVYISLHSHMVNLSECIKQPPAAGILSSNLLPRLRPLRGKV